MSESGNMVESTTNSFNDVQLVLGVGWVRGLRRFRWHFGCVGQVLRVLRVV